MSTNVIGIDAGGTHVRAGVIDINSGEFVTDIIKIGSPSTPEEFVDGINPLVNSGFEIYAIGLGIAGGWNKKGIFKHSPNNPKLIDKSVSDEIEQAYGIPTRKNNDLKVGGRGMIEYCDPNILNLLYNQGTGVNIALALHGYLLPGSEAGHIPNLIARFGRRCGCNRMNCNEAFAGGASVLIMVDEALCRLDKKDREDLRSLQQENSWNNNSLLDWAYTQNMVWAKQIYEETVIPALALNLGIIHLVAAYEKVWWTGGFGQYMLKLPGLEEMLRTEMQKIMVHQVADQIPFEDLPENAPVLGAGLLVAEELGLY